MSNIRLGRFAHKILKALNGTNPVNLMGKSETYYFSAIQLKL